MPITARINHGTKPSYDQVDETGILVKSVEFKPTRTVKERKNASEQTIWYSARDPKLEGSIKGAAVPDSNGALEGLAAVHPGVALAIANFASGKTVHGFTADGSTKVIIKDPTQSQADEEETMLDIPFVFLPGITSYSSATS